MPLSANDASLIQNAFEGNLNEVRDLLLAGANVNAQRGTYGATALYLASQNGHLDVVRLLLKHGKVDVNLQRPGGATALYIASENGRVEVVRLLLQQNDVDVNAQLDYDKATALFAASFNGHEAVVSLLLQHGMMNVNLGHNDGPTALIIASFKGLVQVVDELLKHPGIEVNAKDTVTGATALYAASSEGRVDVVRLLLAKNEVDVNPRHNDGSTALHVASQNGHVEVVRELLRHDNVDVNACSNDGATALMAASYQGHVELVRLLLQRDDVNVNAQDPHDGATALIMASQNGHVEVVHMLLLHDKVDVNAQNKNGETALFEASQQGYQKVVKTLLEHNKVDVNLRCTTGATALHIASSRCRVDVVRELLQNSKVDTTLKDIDGLKAFDVAWRHRQYAVVRVFEDYEKTLLSMEQNRASLGHVMTTHNAEPVELSIHYIKCCMTIRKLGSGAFGDVYLAEDRDLPESKAFVVKMIKLSPSSYGPNDENLKSFQKELSTLKRLHHPNIIVLYGYNFKGSAGEQFLVLEYAANGSLDRFLKDHDMRGRLPAATRLSIMYQVASAVDFLHSGAAGWKVYHRDIKSANICLTEDFTPRLIDCGVAKFVQDENNASPWDTIKQTGSTVLGPAIGTMGYMCPEYTWNKVHQTECDYIPAYDVYSFGVVMAELILGRLNDGKPTNVLQTYVMNDQTPIVDGWKQLEKDADGLADWNTDALEIVCKTVIGCIAPSSHERLSTSTLIDLLKYAIELHAELHAGKSDDEPKDAIAELNSCVLLSQPFTFEDLHDHVNANVWIFHLQKYGVRALSDASERGELERVKLLLQQNDVNVNAKRDTDGATALMLASANNKVDVVRELLKNDNVHVNTQTKNGETALMLASANDHVLIVRELLQHIKVNPNLQRTDDGMTALHIASAFGRWNVFSVLLLNDKVDVNAKNEVGDTALIMVIYHSDPVVVGMLLQNDKVDVNAQNKNGETALFQASREGLQEVVKELLVHNKVDVNLQCHTGATALFIASQNGHLQVVLALLQNNKVDVNLRCTTGATALHIASQNGHVNVVRELLQNRWVDITIEDKNGVTAREAAKNNKKHKNYVECAFKENEKALETVKNDRNSLADVMRTGKADPVELSYHYIKRYKTDCVGSGAFGKVYLAKDNDLPEPKAFVVKMIKLSERSDGSKHVSLESFQKELSTLKRFRHPNIIVLYGYNFNGSDGEQFLVYEYAANGSLDGILKDENKRAELSADKRLSIMYDVAKAVHFLHTGSAGIKVLHRDIKCANICLMEDLTPKLIDCGLAKFAWDDHLAVPSPSMNEIGSTQGPKGSYWYMCPEYAWKKPNHPECEYIAAYDVYSFGVVMAELILGRLNDGKPTNVQDTYVLNRGTATDAGWEQLQKDAADNHDGWNAGALKLVCKTAMGCITPTSKARLGTNMICDLLQYAIDVDKGKSPVEPKVAKAELNTILDNTALGICLKCVPESDGSPGLAVKKCSKGHGLCKMCLEVAMKKKSGANRGDGQLQCLIDGCSSELNEDDLSGCVNDTIHRCFFDNPRQIKFDSKLEEIKESQKNTEQVLDTVASDLDEMKEMGRRMESIIDSQLPAWALQAAHAEQLKQCPTVVAITRSSAPSAVDNSIDFKTRLKNLQTRLKKLGKRKYNVVFYCEHSNDRSHEPFEIWVTKKWMVNVVPWLRIVVNIAAELDQTKLASALVKEFPLAAHSKEMKALIEALEDEEQHGEKQILEGNALQAIADMANKPKNLVKWRKNMEGEELMVAVVGENRRTKWVKKEFQTSYDRRKASH